MKIKYKLNQRFIIYHPFFRKIAACLSETNKSYVKKRFYWIFRRKIDFNNPKSFNEYLNMLKFDDRMYNYHVYADKLKVRNYVKLKVGEEFLVPLLKTWSSVKGIKEDELKPGTILKCNHGSGQNIFLTKNTKFEDVIKKAKRYLDEDYYRISGEPVYRDIPRKLLLEQKLGSAKDINDYKFFCFNGKVRFIQVDTDRSGSHKRNFYDVNWNKLPFEILYFNSKSSLPKPKNLNKMIFLAEKLSEKFHFVRTDLYNDDGKIYFGELTFFPGGGFERFYPSKYDKIFYKNFLS